MATTGAQISTTAIDIKVATIGPSGAAVALTAGTTYSVQNTGNTEVLISEQATAPALGVWWHVIRPTEGTQVVVDTDGLWCRTALGNSAIAVTEIT